MKKELSDFLVTPKVVQSDVESAITITPRGSQAKFDDRLVYTVRFLPMEMPLYDAQSDEQYESIKVSPKNGAIRITHNFSGEQMHLIRVLLDNKKLYDFQIYSLLPDLYAKRPYKGDLHVHSCYSDGKEEPAVVAANYRKAGYDFMAITDHSLWKPSLEAIERYQNIPTDLHLFYGEEIHIMGNYIHAINFGGRSVNEYYLQHKAECDQEIKKMLLSITVPEGVDAEDYAKRDWIAKRIQKNGGLAIFVHPHWISNVYHVGDKTSDYIFSQNTYDAFEVLGGQSVFENNMQTAFYSEQRAKGRIIPIVGSSDSHGTEYGLDGTEHGENWFQYAYTIAFCEDMQLDTIKQSVKNLYTVAVDNYPGEQPRVHGPYRMVKYALFLLKEYFPLYEELCFEQGCAMKKCVLNEDDTALDILKLLQGRTDHFANQFFG